MKKFSLKQNDRVYVIYPDKSIQYVYVEEFYCYGMKIFNQGVIPFYARSFYSCGYQDSDRYFVVKKKWHYHVAVVLDDIRQIYYSIFG